MKFTTIISASLFASTFLFLTQCTEAPREEPTEKKEEAKTDFGGYASQVDWGKHLVTVGACGDCHTPKKMTNMGPVEDSTLLLSGHPANLSDPDVDRKAMESKGLVVTSTLTSWVGPWGVSYAGNITSDPTGIGNWTEENFIRCLREGKLKGIASGRSLLPPMPWPAFRNMTDGELKAIFAYLKSTPPISNVVPQPKAPLSATPAH